ncbi:zona pellucida sperm-binding protein 3 [Stegastes partitus]|uniref:Zona pellucida sperm-binding protein 3 n=1 Tax=Stegastes partitus TaxID=144197 RepID=A0A9Y4MTQ2_9TELE|nr:PREDICTED: zona pellucida sperm-binding protein 3-like [Stegastes partitus]
MGLMHTGLLFLLFCSVSSSQFRNRAGNGVFLQDPELEWERSATVMGEEKTEAPALKSKLGRSASVDVASLPGAYKYEYLRVPYANDRKEDFKPQKGARPLPEWARKMLLGDPPTISLTEELDKRKLVEILCHVDRMYVRINREIFKSRDAYKYLKLGTCPVNQAKGKYYYLLYLLKSNCGFKKERNVDYLSISNVLSYKPTSVVLREMPFDIPLQCKFPRLFYSYKIGFHPKLQGGTVFRALQPKSTFVLTPQDASGNAITGIKSYILGQPMYFQASGVAGAPSSGNGRLYINKCFVTPSQDPNSNVKYPIIDNYGCMIDGKVMLQSKFLPADSKMVQKFSVGAFIFKNVASTTSQQQLYMHCELSVGPHTPTRTSKACNYNSGTKKWEALFGNDCTCACCESTCSAGQQRGPARSIISSPSWKVDLSSVDEYVKGDSQFKSSDADESSLKDPDLAELTDFENDWSRDQ